MADYWHVWRLRCALRGLRQAPEYAVLTIASLGVGIAGVTLVFSVVASVFLDPLPYSDPERTVVVRPSPPWELFERLKVDSLVLDRVAAYNERAANLSRVDEPRRILVGRVTESFLDVTDVWPTRGRRFDARDFQPGQEDVVLITNWLWRRYYAAASEGGRETVMLDDRAYRIVGVLPAKFKTPSQLVKTWDQPAEDGAAVLIPLTGDPRVRDPQQTDISWRGLTILARVRQNITLDRARADVASIATRLPPSPAGKSRPGYSLITLPNFVAGDLPKQLRVLTVAVGVLLLVTCANVSSLVLARGLSRQREIGTRIALGASRRDLMVAVLSETLLVSAGGVIVGVTVAWLSAKMLPALGAPGFAGLIDVNMSWRLMAFAIVATLVTGFTVAVLPALHLSGMDPLIAFRGAAGGSGWFRQHARMRALLVISQIALLFALLVCAGMLAKELVNASRADIGFRTKNILTAELSLSPARYPARTQVIAFFRDLLDRSAALPGIHSAALGSTVPGGPMVVSANIEVDGADRTTYEGDAAESFVACETVGGGYFRTLSIPVTVGRALDERDTNGSDRVVVVNEALVRRYWSHAARALGHRVFFGRSEFTIVGVADNVREVRGQAEPTVYFSFEQFPQPSLQMTLFVRAHSGAGALAAALRRVVRSLDAGQPLYNVWPFERVVFASLERLRALVTMMCLFSAMTILVAGTGVFGAVAHAVIQRRHEMAVRLAIGDHSSALFLRTVLDAMKLVLAGGCAGIPVAYALVRLIGSEIDGIGDHDVGTYAAVLLLISAVGIMGSAGPALQAMRTNPMSLLKDV